MVLVNLAVAVTGAGLGFALETLAAIFALDETVVAVFTSGRLVAGGLATGFRDSSLSFAFLVRGSTFCTVTIQSHSVGKYSAK